jgi:hypothetical protein
VPFRKGGRPALIYTKVILKLVISVLVKSDEIWLTRTASDDNKHSQIPEQAVCTEKRHVKMTGTCTSRKPARSYYSRQFVRAANG